MVVLVRSINAHPRVPVEVLLATLRQLLKSLVDFNLLFYRQCTAKLREVN